MERRLKLQTILEGIMKNKNVYFQPPPSIRMRYPAIVYSLDDIDTVYADDKPYRMRKNYSVTLIVDDPDSALVDELSKLSLCSFERCYIADNLYHYVFSLFY